VLHHRKVGITWYTGRYYAKKLLVRHLYHLLAEGTFYDEGRYERVGPKQEERERKRAIKALERLGYRVSVERVA
jgi:hypothetical protein